MFYFIDLTAVLRWNTTGITVAGIGAQKGNASNQLNFPFGVIVDHAYNIYVADRYNHRIQKFLFENLTGQTIAGNGTAGSSLYQLNNPSRIIIDSEGNLHISEFLNYRILFWPNGAISGILVAGTGKQYYYTACCGLI